MFALTAIQAFFGDSLLLEFGSAPNSRFILIDGGPDLTYQQHLADILRRLKQNGHALDLMVLSHVDTDHVTGLLDFIADLRAGDATLPTPGGLWHNSFGRTIDPNGVLTQRLQDALSTAGAQVMSTSAIAINGISEGNQLRTQALALPLALNTGFPNDLILVDTAGNPKTFGNLTLTVVGPTQANLDALQDQWETWLENHEDAIQSGDPHVMANSDRSVPNLSSIQLLAEADGKTMLLTGDGRSDHLLDGLRMKGLVDSNDSLHVDLLKLPHHGSNRNATKTFFKKITADIYVASADGKDDNPDLSTLIWIVEAAESAGREIKIVCTNETESTDQLVENYPPADFGYELEFMNSSGHEVRVVLAP